jgi:hypothetical protein
MLEIAEARAAILLLDRDAQQAEIAHLPPQIHRELVGRVDLGRARRDLVRGEALHAVAQHVGGLAEIEIERRILVGDGHRFLASSRLSVRFF